MPKYLSDAATCYIQLAKFNASPQGSLGLPRGHSKLYDRKAAKHKLKQKRNAKGPRGPASSAKICYLPPGAPRNPKDSFDEPTYATHQTNDAARTPKGSLGLPGGPQGTVRSFVADCSIAHHVDAHWTCQAHVDWPSGRPTEQTARVMTPHRLAHEQRGVHPRAQSIYNMHIHTYNIDACTGTDADTDTDGQTQT